MTSKYKPTEKKLLTEKKPLTERQEEVMKVLANLKKEDRNIQAQQILGISLNAIYNTRRFAEKKGYTMEDFIEK
jgi:DNA-binding CsgD family transcriptional regulator